MKKLLCSTDKKAEEAEKKKDSVQMKTLLIESNALRKRSQDIMKNYIPKQNIEVKETREKLKLLK